MLFLRGGEGATYLHWPLSHWHTCYIKFMQLVILVTDDAVEVKEGNVCECVWHKNILIRLVCSCE